MALVGAAGRLGVPAKAREVRGVHRVVIRDGEHTGARPGQVIVSQDYHIPAVRELLGDPAFWNGIGCKQPTFVPRAMNLASAMLE